MDSHRELILPFDIDLGYGTVEIKGREPLLEDLLSLPIVAWLDRNVGALNYPRDQREMLNGDGWIIIADWNMLEHWNRPRCRVEVSKPIEQRLITEFWMRFQR